ncbi:MAG: thymidine phosphorylase [Mangrovicoccus sp.]
MDARPTLTRLRNKDRLTEVELRAFCDGLADGEVSDAQAAAFAMGVCINGLSDAETVALTRAMRDSGRRLRWDLNGPILDKHSTGGIGDCSSLVLAPVLAALDCYVPMLSGRGLGHTGGTLDKLESLPGLSTDVDLPKLRQIVARVGCAIVGASAEIAPADRRLYAIRDHTGSVESQSLIVASILSKKLAAGTDALILDVKGGSGAFLQSRAEAEGLAKALVNTAHEAGAKVRAVITDMNQPAAPALGNALEIREVMEVLTDPRPEQRLCQLVLALAGELLALAGMYQTAAEGARAALKVLTKGDAAERFCDMVVEMGGPNTTPERLTAQLPVADVVRPAPAFEAGKVVAIDGQALGHMVVRLGGGRRKADDKIDPSVGLADMVQLGQDVRQGEALAKIHAADPAAAEEAVRVVQAAIQIGASTTVPPLVHGRVDPEGTE